MSTPFAIALAAGMATTSFAQDSVSNNLGGLPGDAIDIAPVNPGDPLPEQSFTYVVDLTAFNTSGDSELGIAPVIKTLRGNRDFFNNLFSSQAISRDIIDVAAPTDTFDAWTTAGAGINDDNNDAPGAVTAPAGTYFQQGLAVSDFGFLVDDNPPSSNSISGAVVNIEQDDPTRLYVHRSTAAVNVPTIFNASGGPQADESQLGFGTIDANGNLFFRADDFGIAGSNGVTGENILRVEVKDRDSTVLNVIEGSTPDGADAAATDLLIRNPSTAFGDTISPANHLAESVVGGAGIAVSPDFNASYNFNGAEPFVAAPGTPDHRITSDHRGGIGSFPGVLIDAGQGDATRNNGTPVYSFGIYTKDPVFSDFTTVLNVWTTDNTGAVLDVADFELPATVVDNLPSNTFSITYDADGSAPDSEFLNYTGATAFRGGTGPTAVTLDAQGNAKAAGVVMVNGIDGGNTNTLTVVRWDPSNPSGTNEWTHVAWVDQTTFPNPVPAGFDGADTGKTIFDSAGNDIGNVTALNFVTGGDPFGPSISSTSFDRWGNAYFIAAVSLVKDNDGFDNDGDGTIDEADERDLDSALLRGVYDPNSFSYELELVAELGQVFTGQNSATDYRIDFLSLASGGTAGNSDPSPGSFWSSNVSAEPYAGVDPCFITNPRDQYALGGLVFAADVTYDTNGDGVFNDPTSANFDNAEEADESYQTLLYVGNTRDFTECATDLDGNGIVEFSDLGTFISLFNSSCPRADFDNNGLVEAADLGAFVAPFLGNQGACP